MIIFVAILFVEILMYRNAPQTMDNTFMLYCLVLVLFQLFVFFISKKKKCYNIKKIYIRHAPIFILCFFIVFFQSDVDYILGFVDTTARRLWIDTTVVCKAMSLSSMALSSILLGYSLYQKYETKKNRIINCKYIYLCRGKYFLCFLCFIMLGIYLLFVPKEFLHGGYGGGTDRGWVSVILVLLQAVMISMFALYCYDYKNRNSTNSYWKDLSLPLFASALYIIIILVTGRRTEAIRILLLIVISYSYVMGRNASRKLIVGGLLAGMFAMSLVGVLRSGKVKSLSEGVSTGTTTETLSFSPLTNELAYSVNTLHIALSNFPDVVNYNYGLTFLSPFCVLVPGLDRLYTSFIQETGLMTRSEDVITTLEFGPNPSYGLGTSIVADVFISFGPIGVVIVFILLGVFIRYLEVGTFCLKKSPYFLVLSFGCCSQFMFACRGSVAILFLSWSYATILTFLFTKRYKTVC